MLVLFDSTQEYFVQRVKHQDALASCRMTDVIEVGSCDMTLNDLHGGLVGMDTTKQVRAFTRHHTHGPLSHISPTKTLRPFDYSLAIS